MWPFASIVAMHAQTWPCEDLPHIPMPGTIHDDPQIAEIDELINEPVDPGDVSKIESLASRGDALLERHNPPRGGYRRPLLRTGTEPPSVEERWEHVKECLTTMRDDIVAKRFGKDSRPSIKLVPMSGPNPFLEEQERQEREHKFRLAHKWSQPLNHPYRFEGPFDDSSAMERYREPDWLRWGDLERWDLVRHFVPLLLNHEPDDAARAPYFSISWCIDNLNGPEVRTLRLVCDAMIGAALGKLVVASEGMITVPTHYVAKPAECMQWASRKRSLSLPRGMEAMTKELDPRVSAAASPVSNGPSFPTLPPRLERRKRQAFATTVAMRYARLEVKGEPGAAAIGLPGDGSVAGYLAPSQAWGKLWTTLEQWVEREGDWGTVFSRLRAWVDEADD